MKKWFVVHTYSGHENKVKLAIETKVRNLALEGKVGEIKIPTYEDHYLAKDGKRKPRMKKTLPGYILINMELDDEAWGVVKTTPGVTNFVGNLGEKRPKPLRDDEVNSILFEQKKEKTVKEKVQVSIEFSVGDQVKVVDGPFNSFSGVIEEVFPDKGRIRVKVEIFGRGTPVELDYLQVRKI